MRGGHCVFDTLGDATCSHNILFFGGGGEEQVNTSLLTLPSEFPSPFLLLIRNLHFWPNIIG